MTSVVDPRWENWAKLARQATQYALYAALAVQCFGLFIPPKPQSIQPPVATQPKEAKPKPQGQTKKTLPQQESTPALDEANRKVDALLGQPK